MVDFRERVGLGVASWEATRAKISEKRVNRDSSRASGDVVQPDTRCDLINADE